MTEVDRNIRRRNPTVVRRQGRITAAQRHALTELLPQYRVAPSDGVINFEALFPGARKFVVEIGFGDGAVLFENARHNPKIGYLGIEVYRPGIGRLLVQLKRQPLDNVRISDRDVRDVMEFAIGSATIDELYVLFPDPWPKKRHLKRRLMQPEFLQLCEDRLKPGGFLIFATDWEEYAMQVADAAGKKPALVPVGDVASSRKKTRYERKAIREGRKVFNLVFKRVPQTTSTS